MFIQLLLIYFNSCSLYISTASPHIFRQHYSLYISTAVPHIFQQLFHILLQLLLAYFNSCSLYISTASPHYFNSCSLYISKSLLFLTIIPIVKIEHEETCEFRPYSCPCPGASCKWQGSLEQVMSHLMQVKLI